MTNQDRKRIAVYSIKSAGATVTAAALAILNAQNGRETTLVDQGHEARMPVKALQTLSLIHI